MSILSWTTKDLMSRVPTRELERLRKHVEGLLTTVSEGLDHIIHHGAGVFPLLNLSEDDRNLYLTAELPGMVPQDIELTVQKDSLTIKGERTIKPKDQAFNYHRRERETGSFKRVISLPVQVDSDRVRAVAKNGVLRVAMPKEVEDLKTRVAIRVE